MVPKEYSCGHGSEQFWGIGGLTKSENWKIFGDYTSDEPVVWATTDPIRREVTFARDILKPVPGYVSINCQPTRHLSI